MGKDTYNHLLLVGEDMLLYPGYHVSIYFFIGIINIAVPFINAAPLPWRAAADVDNIAGLIIAYMVLSGNYPFFT